MHDLTTTPLTMTSRDIADLTGKEHRNVMADIRKMLTELHGEGGLLNFQQSYLNAQNKEQPEFRLPKRETLILVSGYSVAMRARIIDRWQELEAAPPQALNPATLSRMQLIELAMQAEQERLALEHKVEKLAPKAEALDRFATFAEGSMCITNAAKALQQQPKAFFRWLQEHQWIFRRPGGSGWLAYQSRIQVGYLEHKVTTVERGDGSEKVVEQVLVTAKGLAKLSEHLTMKEAA
jgi:Rha family phage regulatory protein